MQHAIRVMAAAVVVLAAVIGADSAMAQVYRCKAGERVLYQQVPCENVGAKGEQMKLEIAPPSTPATPKAPASAPVVVETVSQPGIGSSPPPAQAAPTALERMAETCLDWYRPRLRDPRGAYFRSVSQDKSIVSFDLYATNGFGGYAKKRASCEFKGGQVDDSWTNIHASRLGW